MCEALYKPLLPWNLTTITQVIGNNTMPILQMDKLKQKDK